MSPLFSKLHPFYYPDTPAGGGSGNPTGEMSHEDIIDFLGDDEEKEVISLEKDDKNKIPPKGKEKDKEEEETPPDTDDESEEDGDEDETDELDEIEDELEEPTDEQLELVTPVRRGQILKKYPNLFKEFPYLEKAYYREQQFTEILPTIEDAKQAVEKSETLDRFENDLMGGSTETVLHAVKATNPEGFRKIVDEYLPTLAKVDEPAYFHVIGNMTKHTIVTMIQEARRIGVGKDAEGNPLPGNQLQNAALLLNQFVFGTSEFKPPTQLSRQGKPEENTKEKEIQQREQNFISRQFETTRVDLNTRVNNQLKNTIDAHLDPKKSMTDYVRKNASRDALDSLETLINQDSRFRALVDKLWEKAFQEGFTREATDRIRSAYVAKAKTLLPSVIKKARNEGLRGMGKRVKDEEDSEGQTRNRGPVTPGRPQSQGRSGGKITKAGDIPKGMSTIDFLNSE